MMNIPMLCHLTSTIDNGQPLWAMLIANEYLSPSDPLRQAFRRKAQIALRSGRSLDPAGRQIARAILGGRRLADLPASSQSLLRAQESPRRSKRKTAIIPSLEQRFERRKVLLRRSPHSRFERMVISGTSMVTAASN